MMSNPDHQQGIARYYGKVLQGQRDLKTGACCARAAPEPRLQRLLDEIDPEILERFYGCGSPIPPVITGCTVLDLGCGSGRDSYLVSALVGAQGKVIGVDMTSEQLEVARRHRHSQARRFGLSQANVEFRLGRFEDLAACDITDNSVDVVISNCAINLSDDKAQVFAEIYRVLKPGGELLFSDVFADRRVPPILNEDTVLHAECLAGALYREDFRRMMNQAGWPDFRVLAEHRTSVDNPELEAKLGLIEFCSMTVRAFKLASLEDRCEDYGQVACYLGTITEQPHQFILDDHHTFVSGKPMLVCGNTAAMLSQTRLSRHFSISGDRARHFGLFDCAPRQTTACC